MKKFLILPAFLTYLLFTTCGRGANNLKKENTLDTTKIKTEIATPEILKTLDTTIILSKLEKSNYRGQVLTDNLAKKTLYSYFKTKGYYNSENLPDIAFIDDDALSVSYNKIFLTDLNGNKNMDAIITYWLTPAYASGHCWQPHKAVIADSDNGYKITNEDFIPNNYAIDSVIIIKQQTVIFGYDYECANRKVLKNIRLTLK